MDEIAGEPEKPSDDMDWTTEADMRLAGNEWFGAIIFYCLRRDRKQPFRYYYYYQRRFRRRNVLLGYMLILTLAAAGMGRFVMFAS